MINEKQGNVLDIPSGVIVHGCNSWGVMGSGIAVEIKRRFPNAFKVYRDEYEKCVDSGLIGLPLGTITWAQVDKDKFIVNAVTQQDFGRDPDVVYVDYDALKKAFETLMTSHLSGAAKSLGVHFPLIGCGLAHGKWEVVGPIIDTALGDIDKTLWIFQP